MQIKTFKSYHQEHTKLYEDILSLTMSVNNTYSGHTDWYKNVFIPSLKKGNACILSPKMIKNLIILEIT